jgi:dolichol kinase
MNNEASKSQSENVAPISPDLVLPTRKNMQITRRLFHMANGSVIATLYLISLGHQQMIHLLGTIACLVYVSEQLRITYPEMAAKFIPITKFIMRAEEQLKESAMIPYLIAVLLTIITFPKVVAIVAVYTLALADPMSAIIGIRYGKRRIVSHKSLEGSLAFFITTLTISLTVLIGFFPQMLGTNILVSIILAFSVSAFEMLPIKLDDNLTIPLFTSFALWALCKIFYIPIF